MRIGIDIDGVLARFDQGYARLLIRETGHFLDIENPNWPSEWHWDRTFLNQHFDAKEAKKIENKVWDEQIKPTTFWGTLGEYPGVLESMDRLRLATYAGVDAYFITSRVGHLVKFYTEMWLGLHGVRNPTVLIAHNKGPVIQGLELDAFIDDKPENIRDAVQHRPKIRAYLVDRPYNRDSEILKDWDHYTRIEGIGEMLDIELRDIEKEKAA